MNHVKDAERFLRDLERPMPGVAGAVVTDADLDQDAQSFMAFASAFGIKPPGGGQAEQAS